MGYHTYEASNGIGGVFFKRRGGEDEVFEVELYVEYIRIMSGKGLTEVEIISSEELSKDVYLVSFKRTFDFLPGQVIGIGTEADGPRRLYSICSGKNEEVYHGRVTDYLKTVAHLPEDYKYYLCGRAEMVVEARDILIARGIPFNSIISEIYF
jgi:ferredoxin/flavodoxin---NADP+ reductase